MSLYNMPSGVNHVPGERGYLPRIESCDVCDRELEFNRGNGKWYCDANGNEYSPTWVGKYLLCSEACHSQHMYNIGSDRDRELLCVLARLCNLWLESGIRPINHEWIVQHLHSGQVIDRDWLVSLGDDVRRLLTSFAGEDGDFPKWYLNAIGEVAPDVQMVQSGLGLTDGESFGPAPLALFWSAK